MAFGSLGRKSGAVGPQNVESQRDGIKVDGYVDHSVNTEALPPLRDSNMLTLRSMDSRDC